MSENTTPKKITRTRPIRYPEQMTIMVTTDLKVAIEADAKRESEKIGRRVPAGVIARRYLEAGRAITDAAERAAGSD